MCVYGEYVVFCDMGTEGKMLSSPCRMTIMPLLIHKISQSTRLPDLLDFHSNK